MMAVLTVDELGVRAEEAQRVALQLRAKFEAAEGLPEMKRLGRLLERALCDLWEIEAEIDRRRNSKGEWN